MSGDAVVELFEKAVAVSRNAYAPYSRLYVGSAVRAKSGKVYVGCNVENASFGGTVCAERNAIAAAVAAGEKEILEVMITADTPESLPPCGLCRQTIYEIGPNAKIYMTSVSGGIAKMRESTASELLPLAFEFRVKR